MHNTDLPRGSVDAANDQSRTSRILVGRILSARSNLARDRLQGGAFSQILIVDDTATDATRLSAVLRGILGYDIEIRHGASLSRALDAVREKNPDLVFLDDRLGPIDRAEKTFQYLRAAGCNAPVVVISSIVTRQRRAALAALGVAEVMDKELMEGATVRELLLKLSASA